MATREHGKTGDDLLSRDGRIIAIRLVNMICPVCSAKMHRCGADRRTQMTPDHLVPAIRGGSDFQLVPLCGSCNYSKSDRDAREWLQDRAVDLGCKPGRGASTWANRRMRELVEIKNALQIALVEAGIWTLEQVDNA